MHSKRKFQEIPTASTTCPSALLLSQLQSVAPHHACLTAVQIQRWPNNHLRRFTRKAPPLTQGNTSSPVKHQHRVEIVQSDGHQQLAFRAERQRSYPSVVLAQFDPPQFWQTSTAAC